jgi:hypothetical protein
MQSPSDKRKLRSVHAELSKIVAQLCGLITRANVVGGKIESGDIERVLDKIEVQQDKIDSILHPPCRRSRN